MNGSPNKYCEFPEEIKINQIKLSLEKLENLQRISLRKKINSQKEILTNKKKEKNLENQLDSLKQNNEELKLNIEKIEENIKLSKAKNIDISNQANELDKKIIKIETENSKEFSEVKN